MLSSERARELLDYDRMSGLFVWKTSRGRVGKGALAGRVDRYGYISIQVDGRTYRAHRLAWLMVHGVFPAGEIDHKDGDRMNNRFANLRHVTNAENQQNQRRAKAHNKTGLLGVSAKRGRWRAQIVVNGKAKHLGFFDTPQLAHAAYVEAKRTLHPMGCI